MEITKEEIIAMFVETGMTLDEAEKEYEAQYGDTSDAGAPKLPFPLAKVNSSQFLVSKGVPLGTIVWDAIRDESKRVIGYNEIHAFEDLDFVIVAKNTAYSHWSQPEKKVLAKTLLASPYQAATKYQDVNSGRFIKVKEVAGKSVKYLEKTATLPELTMGYQLFTTVGIRPKGSSDEFTYVNMFLKTVILYGINKVSDTVASDDNNALKVLNLVTKEDYNGDSVFTAIDLNASTAKLLPAEDFKANLKGILTARTAHRKYVEAINKFYIDGSEHLGNTEAKETSEDSNELPE